MKNIQNSDLKHINTWLFDLDNTLYPATSRLFDQIDVRIGRYIADFLNINESEARVIQKTFFREHGTTLRGLMNQYDITPIDFLNYVHDIDFSILKSNEALDKALNALPGRKLIFTNADVPYSEKILSRLGISHHFETIYDIVAANYEPKPFLEAYNRLISLHQIKPKHTIFFEDIARNLVPAAELGMTTVWVRGDENWVLPGNEDAKPDYETDDLVSWLKDAQSLI